MNLRQYEQTVLDASGCVLGFSGGRTSAMLACLAQGATLCFQNTGLEHPLTLDFIKEFEDATGRNVTWLEFRPPAEKGAALKYARFEVVNYKTASRDGFPFLSMMESYADYRAAKGEPALAPWARARFCSSYLKIRTQTSWERATGFEPVRRLVGLRADEPERVYRLTASFRAPLYEFGVTKQDVNDFWASQSFDLLAQDYQGNCTGCFLKDQSDLARVLAGPDAHASVWEHLEASYGDFGGQRFAGYRRLREEASLRQSIESALRAGRAPHNDGSMDEARFKLVVIQERKRLAGQKPSFSCNCEGAETIAKLAEDED